MDTLCSLLTKKGNPLLIHLKTEMNLRGVQGSQTQDYPLCGPLEDEENNQVWLPQGGGGAG